ncbi:hypothetical protein [Dyadobacter crusticola]|uniref:hypothetical protein n=1 Tax=Dyadobacter crusticola TaxID=292407 RepID=UPI0004E107E0|nr:hypothetical protein [Dyadobacter crusticola]
MSKIITATSILILLAVTVWGQESGTLLSEKQTAYANALLDSAYRYELLKPTFFHLKTAYESRGKEIDDLRNALRMSELQTALQKQSFEATISEERKKTRKGYWKGFKHGFGAGFPAGFLTGLSVH